MGLGQTYGTAILKESLADILEHSGLLLTMEFLALYY